MVNCEVCGKFAARHVVLIEGAKSNVCEMCAKHGKILDKPTSKKVDGGSSANVSGSNYGKKTSAFKSGKKDENRSYNMREEIIENYGEVVRREFNKSGKTYKEFANSLNESESYMRKIIRGEMMPTISTARKLEKALGITLIEESEKEKINLRGTHTDDLTLGDLVEIKKKKK